jgi:hypothetical protein
MSSERAAAAQSFRHCATGRSIAVAGRMGFGLMLSRWTPFAELAHQTTLYG